ncbi:hypothetical protein B481_1033 [Planococcus halocryophilus Or1]|uniref:hypothetical protein n=1 Tax=Planococcus halocryophilus TaxID=1215089 RepID=UPI0002B88CB2|nr:hypothetical protein [Planococcus halocryophilus]EMF47445.1 hypothetical protein B481_1033 [Planococcus halocryophilus Or1]
MSLHKKSGIKIKKIEITTKTPTSVKENSYDKLITNAIVDRHSVISKILGIVM